MVRVSRSKAHLVTEARRPMSEDITYRQRRYLIMMGLRVVCFVVAIILFANGAGWLTAFPAVGAIIIPYFAVVFANGGREPTSQRGFQAYEPRLPDRYTPPPPQYFSGRPEGRPTDMGSNGSDSDMAGNNGAPSPMPQTPHPSPPGNG
jgi:hypothetical protein